MLFIHATPHRTLPDHEDPPAASEQGFNILAVSANVRLQLANPEFPPRCRRGGIGTASVAMPETPMHEDRYAAPAHYDVR